MAEIVVERVSKDVRRRRPAVDDVSLRIEDGEFMVLVGPSGCGKSTLLRLIAGLEESTAGAISIGERDVTDLQPRDRDIAMVFQSYALYPHMTVRQNLGYGLKVRRALEARGRRAGRARSRGCSASTSCSTGGPARSRAASGSGWRWAARSCASRRPS